MSLSREQMLVEMGITPIWVLRDTEPSAPAVEAEACAPAPEQVPASVPEAAPLARPAPAVALRDRMRCTSLVVTHDMTTVFQVADRIAFIYDRRIRAVGTAEEMRRSPDARVRGFIEGDPTPFED